MEKKDCRQLLKDTLPLLLSFERTIEEVIQKIVIVSFFLFCTYTETEIITSYLQRRKCDTHVSEIFYKNF